MRNQSNYTSEDVHPARKLFAIFLGSITMMAVAMVASFAVTLLVDAVYPGFQWFKVLYWVTYVLVCILLSPQCNMSKGGVVYGFWMRRIAKLEW